MIEANRHPVNVQARLALQALKQPVNQQQTYLHQLLMHFLTTGEHPQDHATANRLKDFLELVDAEQPAALLPFLDLPADLPDDPAELAELALNRLHLQMEAQTETVQ
jgi:hypothetical protein